MTKNKKYVDIYVTAKPSEARKIAKRLVKKRLTACVNLFPIKSIYRWKGKIIEEKETALLIKTKSEVFDQIKKEVKDICSYEVPCIILKGIEKANKTYLDWLDKEVR